MSGEPWKRGPLVKRARQRLRRELGSRFCMDLGRDHRSAIFVAGSARSGTTWLTELINHRNEYHYMFEPFHPPEAEGTNPSVAGLPAWKSFGYRLYMRPDNEDPRYVKPASDILAGRERSRWTERFNQRLIARQRIIKDITANLFLKWLNVRFPGMPIVMILRHPCAVAASRRSLNWDSRWEIVLSEVLQQRELVDDFMGPFVEMFHSASTYMEQQVLMWCLDNYVPLKQFGRNEIHIVFYEQLVAHPEVEIPRLFAFLGKPPDPAVYAALATPSLLSDWNNPVLVGANRMDSWMKVVDRSDVRRAVAVLTVFGLDAVYSEEPLPNVAGLKQVMPATPALSVGA